MADSELRLEQMVARLRERGHRITAQRRAILEVLARSVGHPSAEQVFRIVSTEFPKTSLATVYKTVTALKEAGEVLELEFSQDSNRYDGNQPYPHPHVLCVTCHQIVDLDLTKLGDMADEVTGQTGFRILTHRLDFYGLCPKCQE
ncbi:MAG: transcriptional repressor [Deltaproteobacteria bacterium]|nr:transcriptional repressor [Deltaproteobacteria bacterium]